MKVCYISHPHTAILAELLLTHKARPDVATLNDGSTAAHIAVENDHVEMLEILAHYGADMSKCKTSPPSDSPLHLAVRKASFTIVAKLIALGAKADCKNSEGKTFLQVTVRRK